MSRQHATPVTKAAALAALAGLFLAAASPARAQTASDLEAARAKAARLEAEITREQAEAGDLQRALRTLARAAEREEANLEAIRSELEQTNARVDAVKAQLEALRARIRERARRVWEQGPLQFFGVVLGAQSIGDFTRGVYYASKLAQRDNELVLRARDARAELVSLQERQVALEREQTSKVAALHARERSLTDAFARQQAVLAQLARARAQALQLVAALAARLGAGLAGLRRVAGQGMTISYGEWAASFLGTLGAPITRNNLVVIVAWEAAEGTMATWNPLATTYPEPGATIYNSAGVRNYVSKEQGIQATIATLSRPGHGYEAIVSNLRSSSDPMQTAQAINRSDWCSGCADGSYVVAYVPAVEQYYDRYAG